MQNFWSLHPTRRADQLPLYIPFDPAWVLEAEEVDGNPEYSQPNQ
jgi:hypothetical protein